MVSVRTAEAGTSLAVLFPASSVGFLVGTQHKGRVVDNSMVQRDRGQGSGPVSPEDFLDSLAGESPEQARRRTPRK